jgi:putative chitinase
VVTREAILKVAPAAAPYVDELLRQMRDNGIDTPLRAAHFLGRIMVESGGFKRPVESLNYSLSNKTMQRFIKWGRISAADAAKFCKNGTKPANQSALANILYGGAWGAKHLGNTQPGDGWRFRGRGLKQLTGRDNYDRFSRWWLGTDELLRDPDRVARADGAVASAIWFWMSNKLNAIADRDDTAAVVKAINGGDVGLQETVQYTNAFKLAFA